MNNNNSTGEDNLADSKLRFETNAALTHKWQMSGNREPGDRKNYLRYKFGVRAKDGNIYSFTLTLFNVLLPGEEGTQENFMTVLPPVDYPGIMVEQEVVFGPLDRFHYSGDLVKVNKDNALSWKLNRILEGSAKTRTCTIKIKIKGKLKTDYNFDYKEIAMLKFLFKTSGNLEIGFEGDQESGKYWVDKSLIVKESEVIEDMLTETTNTQWVNSRSEKMLFASGHNLEKHFTILDSNRVAVEAFIIFCYTGYVPMSAIGQELAELADR